MINRTIAAALLAGLASPVLAGAALGPAYDSAKAIGSGASSNMTFDGNASQTAAVQMPAGGPTAGVPGIEMEAAASRPALTADVPEPQSSAETGSSVKKSKAGLKGFFNKRSLMFGAGGAAAGAGIGFIFGGPIGAVLGAVAGFAIGFLLSKILHKKR